MLSSDAVISSVYFNFHLPLVYVKLAYWLAKHLIVAVAPELTSV